MKQTPDDDTGGLFVLPKIGSETGLYYLVHATIEEHWTQVAATALGQERSLGAPEIAYIRNLFFNPEVVVVTYIPNYEAVKRLAPRLFLATEMYAPTDGHMRVPPQVNARIR